MSAFQDLLKHVGASALEVGEKYLEANKERLIQQANAGVISAQKPLAALIKATLDGYKGPFAQLVGAESEAVSNQIAARVVAAVGGEGPAAYALADQELHKFATELGGS